MSYNLVIIMGNLTRDPEMKYTPSGTAVAEFGVAVNEVWHDAKGEKQERVTFIDVTCWQKSAEWAEKFLKKGANIHVTGRLQMDTWDDKQTGQKRSKLRVVASQLTPCFATWKDGEGKRTPSDEEQRPSARTPAAPAKRQAPLSDPDLDPPSADEPPF